MGLFSWLAKRFGGGSPARTTQAVSSDRVMQLEKELYPNLHARYDAAQTTSDNVRHWSNADFFSAETANNPGVRRTLRSRARYECHEGNSIAQGLVLTLAQAVIGVGPRLKIRIPNNPEASNTIERQFAQWARAVRLAEKLRTAKIGRVVDGEAFIQQVTNSQLPTPVQLDIALNEPEQIASDGMVTIPAGSVDGIDFDEAGNPVRYHRLRTHPGGREGVTPMVWGTDPIPGEQMIHTFRVNRAGQKRGIPEVTTCLPLFAMLRRFDLATLSAAEAVANVSAVLYTDGPAVEADEVDPMDTIQFERNMMLSLPRGWKMGQLKAEQPTSTFDEFQKAIVREIARCLQMPLNVAILDSRGANFASGKLDILTFDRSVEQERAIDWDWVLDRIFGWWLEEAMMIPGYLPEDIGAFADFDHEWMWPASSVIDEEKHATAVRERLKSGITTHPIEYARMGLDWEMAFEAAATALGVSVEEYQELLRLQLYANGNMPQAVSDSENQGSPNAEPEDEEETADAEA